MTRRALRLTLLFVAVLSAGENGSGQVMTGLPPFASMTPSTFDTVNDANLNVFFAIPVVAKAGVGMPFQYSLAYNNSVWVEYTSSGTAGWTPNGNWGWGAGSSANAGTMGYRLTQGSCYYPLNQNGRWYYWNVYNYTAYYDPNGTPHIFNHIVSSWTSAIPCGSGAPPRTYTGTVTDGSGYTITVTANPDASVYPPSGQWIYIALGLQAPSGSIHDTNGNEVVISTTSGTTTYTDTLGATALTVAAPGGGNNSTFTYTGPNGNAAYTMKYSSYTVKTNFGCSGIPEYGPTAQYLVSEIDLPDHVANPTDKYIFTYETTPGYSPYVTGRIASVTLPTGGTISYVYSGGSNGITCQDTSTATLTRTTPDGTWVYAHTESPPTWTTTITDPNSNDTVITFYGDYGGDAYETERKVYEGSSTLEETVDTCYNGSSIPCLSTTVSLPITNRKVEVTLPGLSPSETSITYNSYGLPTETDEYTYGPTLLRKTVPTYTGCGVTNSHVLDRPCSMTVENPSGGAVASTTYSYDANGNLLNTTSGGLTKHYTHNSNGAVATTTDVNGTNTTYSYGSASCNGAFPTSIAPPVGPTLTLNWNCNGGVMTSINDTNGTTSYGYTGPFWRVTSITDPTNAVTNIAYSPTTVERTLNFGSNSTVDILTNLDGLGRVSMTQRRQSQTSGTYDSVETVYDSVGRPFKVSPPYSAGAGLGYGGSVWNQTTYDVLNRPTSVTDAGGGSVAFSYSANDVLRTVNPAPSGENPKRAQYQYDALGRLQSVCEITGASGSGACTQNTAATGFFTSYGYDALNDLQTVSQSGQTRTYNYDSLGRLTSEANPETGTTTYTYDTVSSGNCGAVSAGDLVMKLDAAGNGTCYTYDPLHRRKSMGQSYNSSPNASVTPDKCFIYDSATVNGVAMSYAGGRLAEAYTVAQNTGCNAAKITDEGFSYSKRGEVAGVLESTPHSSGYYGVGATYWANGLVDVLTGPALPTMTYTPDGEGRVNTVGASSGQNPVSSTSYNVFGLPTAVTLGSGDSDTYSYDPNTGRMDQYDFTVNGLSVIGNLAWNANGSLANLAITDPYNSANNQSCAYTHDDLARISSVNCGGDPLVNPDVENGNTGWNLGNNFSIVNNPANAQAGNWYLSVSSTVDSWAVNSVPTGPNWIPVTPGEVINIGGWIERVGGTGSLDWSCEIVDANHNLVAWCNPAALWDGSGGTAWQFYSAQTTIPANAAYVQFFAEVHCCGESNNTLTTGYFDSAFFEGASLWSQTFSNDAFSNLSKSGTITFQPGFNSATNRANTGSYDANGNLTGDGVNTYSWDADGNVVNVSSNYVGNVGLTFDALDRIAERNINGSYTQYVYGTTGSRLAITSGQTLAYAVVPLAGGTTAVYNASGLAYYRHGDWQGSSRLTSLPSGASRVSYDGAYAPYGESYAEMGSLDHQFTGKNQDIVPGGPYQLYDFPAREYHPTWGRWVSPDPAGLGAVDPSNPQSWNRYAYVTNNPLALTDPLGLDACAQAADPRACHQLTYWDLGNSIMPSFGSWDDPFSWEGIPVVEQSGYDWIPFGIFGQGPSGSSPIGDYQSWFITGLYWGPIFQPVGDAFTIVSDPIYIGPQVQIPPSSMQAPPKPPQVKPLTPGDKAVIFQACVQNPSLFMDDSGGNMELHNMGAAQVLYTNQQQAGVEPALNNPEAAQELQALGGFGSMAANAPACAKMVNGQ